MAIKLLLAVLCSVFCFAAHARAQVEPPSDEQVMQWLRELEPLPKVHYSWPLPFQTMPDELLYEYVRLTGAASVSGEWTKPEQIQRCVATCKKVNAGKPRNPASIAVNYSVWHRRFDKELPPTDTGPTHAAELDHLRERLETIRDEVAAANDKQKSTVKVSAILFDSEHFRIRRDDDAWNAALDAKYNAAWDIARDIFPGVRIEWYARGSIHPAASASGWSEAPYFTLNEKGDTFGCSLYQVPEIGQTREIMRRTAQHAQEHGVDEITPWIALASGYRRQTEKYHTFSFNWNYDLIYSWHLGAEINNPWYGAPERHERFAPWNKAKVAIFYPEPFGREIFWGSHFVAYVRGATGVKKLPE